MVIISFSKTVIRGDSQDSHKEHFQRHIEKSSSRGDKVTADTKSHRQSPNPERKFRNALTINSSEVGLCKLPTNLFEDAKALPGSFEEQRYFSISKSDLVEKLIGLESTQSVPPIEYLKRAEDLHGQFEYVGEQIENSNDRHRSTKIEVHGSSYIIPDGTRRIQLRDTSRKTLEWLPDPNGDLIPRISETTHETILRIPDNHVLVLTNAEHSTKALVLFFDDPDSTQ